MLMTFFTTTLAIFGTIFNNNLWVHIGIVFVIGLFASGRVAVSFIYLMELLTPKYAAIVATMTSMFYVCFFAFITAYFKFLSKDYVLITYVGAGFGLVSFVGIWLTLDESALFLLRNG